VKNGCSRPFSAQNQGKARKRFNIQAGRGNAWARQSPKWLQKPLVVVPALLLVVLPARAVGFGHLVRRRGVNCSIEALYRALFSYHSTLPGRDERGNTNDVLRILMHRRCCM
jgi:hypothetical protein